MSYIYDDTKLVRKAKMAMKDNNVDWYGLDRREFDNRNEISDLTVGDTVWVLDLSNYVDPQPKLPAKAEVTAIYEYEIDVKFPGSDKEWEIYESQFGIKKTADFPVKLI